MEDLTRSQRNALRDQRAALSFVLSSEQGRRFVRSLIDASGVYANDEGEYARGRRSIGLSLIAETNAINDKAFVQMMIEAANERTNNRHTENNDVD